MFDKTIYPFSTLHPNAGARLRAEILLLPDSLLGDEHTVSSSAPDFPSANDISQVADTSVQIVGPAEKKFGAKHL